jgi:hypothetical protein
MLSETGAVVRDSSRLFIQIETCSPDALHFFAYVRFRKRQAQRKSLISAKSIFVSLKKVLISEGAQRNFPQAVVFEHVVKAGGTHGGSHQDAWRLY